MKFTNIPNEMQFGRPHSTWENDNLISGMFKHPNYESRTDNTLATFTCNDFDELWICDLGLQRRRTYQDESACQTRNARQSPSCSPSGANAPSKLSGYWMKVHQIFLSDVDGSSAVLTRAYTLWSFNSLWNASIQTEGVWSTFASDVAMVGLNNSVHGYLVPKLLSGHTCTQKETHKLDRLLYPSH